MKRKKVLGNMGKIYRVIFLSLMGASTILFGLLIFFMPSKWMNYSINIVCYDTAFLFFAIFIPRMGCLVNYTFEIDEFGAYIYNKDEKVIYLKWDEVEVSLGSVINRGSTQKPNSSLPAIIICKKELLLDPMIYPFASFKGQGERIALLFSKENLYEVSKAYKRRIRGDIDAKSCLLSCRKVDLMERELSEVNSSLKKEKNDKKDVFDNTNS